MPFSASEFLDVFAAYNSALWPFAVSLWVITAGVCVAFIVQRAGDGRVMRLVLAGHWLWAGVMYHALFFTVINPAAWLFAVLFVVQAMLFLTPGSSVRASPARFGSIRHLFSSALIVYSLLYPAVARVDGFIYPRAPTFGVPCPTVVLTVGFLFATSASSVLLSVIPIAWSALGMSAVLSFGVHADVVLPAAGTLLAMDVIVGRRHVMRKLSFARVLVVLVSTLLFISAPRVLAQASQHDHETSAQSGGMKMDHTKMDGKMMEEMTAKHRANTERITALMAKVKTASGDARVMALADAVAVLLEERAAMGDRCALMMKK